MTNVMETIINTDIKAAQVRLIDQNGEQVGVISRNDALYRAREAGLDLVVVSDKADPPVCKIVDYGKFKYEQSKKEKEAAKKQRANRIETKELNLRPVTDEGDLTRLIKRAQDFIAEGNKVRVSVKFQGREMAHKNLGVGILQRFISGVANGQMEGAIQDQGKAITALLSLKKEPA